MKLTVCPPVTKWVNTWVEASLFVWQSEGEKEQEGESRGQDNVCSEWTTLGRRLWGHVVSQHGKESVRTGSAVPANPLTAISLWLQHITEKKSFEALREKWGILRKITFKREASLEPYLTKYKILKLNVLDK